MGDVRSCGEGRAENPLWASLGVERLEGLRGVITDMDETMGVPAEEFAGDG